MMKRLPTSGAVMLSTNNRVLVVNMNGTAWSLVKGGIEPQDENLKATLRREVEEESGIRRFKIIKVLGTYERHVLNDDGKTENKDIIKPITIYLCTTEETELNPIDPANPEARWVDLDAVEELLTHPKDKEFYKSVLPEVKKFIETR